MEWYKFADKQPEINKLLVVFRYKKKVYVAAKLEKSISHQGNKLQWRSSSSNNELSIDQNDRWTLLEPITLTETYK